MKRVVLVSVTVDLGHIIQMIMLSRRWKIFNV